MRKSLTEFRLKQPNLERLEERVMMAADIREPAAEAMLASTNHGYLYGSATDGTWIVGAYQDGTVEVRGTDGKILQTMQTGTGRAYAVTVEDGVAYVSAGAKADEGTVIAWDCANGEELWRTKPGNSPGSLRVRDGVVGIDVSYMGVMTLDSATGAMLRGGDSEGYYGTLLDNGVVVYVKAGNQIWIDDGGSRRLLFRTGGNVCGGLAVNLDGSLLAIGRQDGGMEVWETSSWTRREVVGAGSRIYSVGWSDTGGILVSGSENGTVVEWAVGENGTLAEVSRTNIGKAVFMVGEANGAVLAQGGESGALWKEIALHEERVPEKTVTEEMAMAIVESKEMVEELSAESQAEIADILFAQVRVGNDEEEQFFSALSEGPGQPEVEEESAEEASTPTVDRAAMILAVESSLHAHGMELPPMQRRLNELDREMPIRLDALKTAQAKMTVAQDYVRQIINELTSINTALKAAKARGDGWAAQQLDGSRISLENNLNHAYSAETWATATLNTYTKEYDDVCDERANIVLSIAQCEDGLRNDATSWMILKMLDGMSGDDAELSARTMVDRALQEGFDAMPHVKPLVSILDTNMASSYEGGAQWIATVTEVREHKSPVLTRDGGALRIIGRIHNNGDRAGWITVEATGVSDLVPNPRIQQRLEVFLAPGESRDFAMTIGVPGGTERAGSISLRALTPDEDVVRNDKLVQQPKGTMDAYRQGIDAVAHNARSILLSPGGTGSAQSRVENYLASAPEEAAILIAEAQSGKNILDAQTTASLIAAGNSSVLTIAMAQRQEVLQNVFENNTIPLNLYAMADTILDTDDSVFHGTAPEMDGFIAMQEALSWYNGTIPPGMTVRTDTLVGRIAAGLASKAANISASEQVSMAFMLQHATGISATRTLSALQTPENRRTAAIQRLFTGNGYAMIEAPDNSIIRASTDKTTYDSGMVRVNFDIPSGKTIQRAMLTPSGLTANQELPSAFILAQTTSRTFIEVDVTKLQQLMIQGANVSLTVQLEMTDGSVILEETNGFEVKILQQSSPIFDVQTIVGQAWNSLSKMQQEHITAALDFPDLNNLPSGNQAILNYLINTFLLTTDSATRLQYDTPTAFEGTAHGTGLMQCKEWLQQVVIKQATGITVSGNAEITTGAWVKSDYEIGRMANGEAFKDMLDRVGAKAGDVVQMYVETPETSFPHTMVIGKITSEGIWVFDTNFGTNDEWKTMDEGTGLDLSSETMGYYDEQTGTVQALTKEDILRGVTPNRWLQQDNTVRYHFLTFDWLSKVVNATLQRIPAITNV